MGDFNLTPEGYILDRCTIGLNLKNIIRNLFILIVHCYIMVGMAFIVVSLLVVGIWMLFELRRFKHKLFAIFLIILILFTFFSFTAVLKGQDIDYKTIPGITKASKLYFSWLTYIFGNFKTITTSAVKLDWKSNNQTIG